MRHVSKAKLSLAVALAIAGFVMPNMVVDAAYTAPYTVHQSLTGLRFPEPVCSLLMCSTL